MFIEFIKNLSSKLSFRINKNMRKKLGLFFIYFKPVTHGIIKKNLCRLMNRNCRLLLNAFFFGEIFLNLLHFEFLSWRSRVNFYFIQSDFDKLRRLGSFFGKHMLINHYTRIVQYCTKVHFFNPRIRCRI